MKRPTTTGQTTRRTVLRGIGAAGITTGFGAGIGAAQPEHARSRGAENQRKRRGNREQNRPGHKDFECPEGMEHLGTFEFVVEEDEDGNVIDCYFEHSEGDESVTIADFDSKDDEECEPVTAYYTSDSHTVGQISSFGGMDTHVDEEPADGVYESELENRGGQQAAISLLHICGTVLDDGDTGDDGANGEDGDDGADDSEDNGDGDDIETL